MLETASHAPEPARQYTQKRKALLQVRIWAMMGVPALFVALGAADLVSRASIALTHSLYFSAGVVWVVLYAALLAASVPISVIQFRLDEKFGVARGNLKQRLIDAAKSNAIGFLFGLALVEIVFAAMNLPGEYTWFVAAMGVSFLYATLVYVLPSLLPLFYRMSPLGDTQLSARLKTLAFRAGVQVAEVYEWQVSGRTRRANALVAGFGKSRKVILTDTLIGSMTEEEIEALIAHEYGHCANDDVVKRVLLQTALFIPIFWALQGAVLYHVAPWTDGGWSNPAVVPVFWCLWLILSLYGNLVMAGFARRQERRADRFAFEHVASVLPFISGMKKLTSLNLIEYDKSSQWKYTHPATRERIAAAEQFARERGQWAEAMVAVG